MYQKCPVCNGTGLVSILPGVAGDMPTFTSSSCGPWPCRACGGRGTMDDDVQKMLDGLPKAADCFNSMFQRDMSIFRLGQSVYDRLMNLAEEAENHRIDYARRAEETGSTREDEYWKGRRDEAGHFRDRILVILESLGK